MCDTKLTCCGLDCDACNYREAHNCDGCQSSDGVPFHGECKTAKCCLARGLKHCGECADFPCSLVESNAFDPEHGEGVSMLLRLAKDAGKPILGSKVLMQVGILVHDVDATCAAWAELLGVPMPKTFWCDGYDKTQAEYNGERCDARCKQGFFQMGPVQFELIQPDEKPSVWRDCLDANGEGLHHIAFHVKNMKQKTHILAEMGYPTMQKGEYTGGRYAYADARKDLKMILELLEND